jgi:hypothetical protein
MNDQIKEVALKVARDTCSHFTANAVHGASRFEFRAFDLFDFAEKLLAELSKDVEPVAWRYRSKITGAETINNQPPDRVVEVNQFDIEPLYTRPQTIEAAVLQEREECAKVCDAFVSDDYPMWEFGAAIRARNKV